MRQGGKNRSRGRNGRKPHVPMRIQTFDSAGPEVRVRGNAWQVHERYLNMARDAQAAGDRVAAENYYQHADHYYRMIALNGDGRPQHGHGQHMQGQHPQHPQHPHHPGPQGQHGNYQGNYQQPHQPGAAQPPLNGPHGPNGGPNGAAANGPAPNGAGPNGAGQHGRESDQGDQPLPHDPRVVE